MEKKRLTAQEIEESLPISAETLHYLFDRGMGPKAERNDAGELTYDFDEVVAWLAENKKWERPF